MLDTKGNKITYFGHSTFSLTTPSGQVGLIDPFVMHNPSCPDKLKQFSRLDAIFVSHAHGDHFADCVELAKQHSAKVFAIFETAMWLHGKGIDKAHPMGKGGSQKFGDFEVTLTNAFHSNSIEEGGKLIYAGEPSGLIIRMPGGFTLYHAGDTCVFGDMKIIAEIYKPDVALLANRRQLHHGPERSRLRHAPPRRKTRDPHALRHISTACRHARPIQIRNEKHPRPRSPRHATRRHATLTTNMYGRSTAAPQMPRRNNLVAISLRFYAR